MGGQVEEGWAKEGSKYRATVEYDGTDYYGFQVQPDRPTVQGAIEAALGETAGEATRLLGAGRTDTGVHALGQVISFRLAWRHSVLSLQRALNSRLPADIVIRDLDQAAEGFHPRFSARSRAYRYTVLNQPLRSPMSRRFSHLVPGALDLSNMNEAAQVFVGRHDFGTFGNPTQGEITERHVLGATWTRSGSWLRFDVEANGFLRRMVRTVVSALLAVGRGDLDKEGIAVLLAERDRAKCPPPALACGLCLMEVKY